MKIRFHKNKEDSGSGYHFVHTMYESITYSKIPSLSYMALNVIRHRGGFRRSESVLKEAIKIDSSFDL